MKQYEHMVLYFRTEHCTFDEKGFVTRRKRINVIEANGHQLGAERPYEDFFGETRTEYGPPFPQLEKYLWNFGEKGWEVVGLNHTLVILKRLKPEVSDD